MIQRNRKPRIDYKYLERKYGNLENRDDVILFMIDKFGNFLLLNQKSGNIFEREVDELIGEHFVNVVHDSDISNALSGFQRIIMGEAISGFELSFDARYSGLTPVQIDAVPIYDGDRIYGVFGIGVVQDW